MKERVSTVTNWHRMTNARDNFKDVRVSNPVPRPKKELVLNMKIVCNPKGGRVLEEVKSALIEILLKEWQNNSAIARALGVSSRTIKLSIIKDNLVELCSDRSKEVRSKLSANKIQ